MAGHIADAGRVDWCTPKSIIDAVRTTFGGEIGLDPCSNDKSIVGAKVEYKLPQNDGLVDPWDAKTVFVNPPYGRCHMHRDTRTLLDTKITYDQMMALPQLALGLYKPAKNGEKFYRLDVQAMHKTGAFKSSSIADWVDRCVKSYVNGSDVILLIPAAVDTKHWQEHILPSAVCVNLLKGRVHFDGTGPAPMACALIYWGRNQEAFVECTRHLGWPVDTRWRFK